MSTQEDLFGGDGPIEPELTERLPDLLRGRCCRNEPHAGPDPAEDHGHTDCYFMGLAAREIERLRALTRGDTA